MKNLSDAQKIIAQGNREETKEERLQRLEEEERAEIKQAEGAKKSPYFNFLQVNQANYKAEDWLMRESPPAYRLLRFIAQNMDNYNALMCSYKVFQESLYVLIQGFSGIVGLRTSNNSTRSKTAEGKEFHSDS